MSATVQVGERWQHSKNCCRTVRKE